MRKTKTVEGRDGHPWDMKPDAHLHSLARGPHRHLAERAEEELARRSASARAAAESTPPLFAEENINRVAAYNDPILRRRE